MQLGRKQHTMWPSGDRPLEQLYLQLDIMRHIINYLDYNKDDYGLLLCAEKHRLLVTVINPRAMQLQ